MQTSVAAARPAGGITKSRMPGEQRRQHFIEAALHLFSTRGFRGTTTKAIAEAAGVSEGLLFRHFSSKEDLYAAILREKARQAGFDTRLEALRRHARRDDDARLVHELVRAILDSYRRDPDFERLMLHAALEGHELASASQRLFGRPALTFLQEYVARRQAAGVLRAGDPALLVFALVSLPAYFGLVTHLLGGQFAGPSDREVIEAFTRVILDGVRAGSPSSPPPEERPAPKTAREARRP
jgi:TetR/AcrR family transcriptional regulator